MTSLRECKKCENTRIHLDTMSALDGRTDGRTDRHVKHYRALSAMHADVLPFTVNNDEYIYNI